MVLQKGTYIHPWVGFGWGSVSGESGSPITLTERGCQRRHIPIKIHGIGFVYPLKQKVCLVFKQV